MKKYKDEMRDLARQCDKYPELSEMGKVFKEVEKCDINKLTETESYLLDYEHLEQKLSILNHAKECVDTVGVWREVLDKTK